VGNKQKMPEHVFWMVRGLEQALTQGIEVWAEDTSKRMQWLYEDDLSWHVLAGTMLTGCFAYAEGRMGPRWWENVTSDAARRDLHQLWIARNAFVHKDSKPADLNSTTDTHINELKEYCARLSSGEILDDLGNSYPTYMRFDSSEIRFTREAIHVIARLFETVYRWSNK